MEGIKYFFCTTERLGVFFWWFLFIEEIVTRRVYVLETGVVVMYW
jgi:hypothetical protein